MTYKEKGIWISLVTTLLIFGYYFVKAFQMANSGGVGHKDFAIFFVSIIVMIIIVEIISHIILTIAHRPETEDERDQLIELKATRNAYYILVAGVWIAIGQFWFSTAPLLVIHIILFFFILGEILSDITKLVYYRRGI